MFTEKQIRENDNKEIKPSLLYLQGCIVLKQARLYLLFFI